RMKSSRLYRHLREHKILALPGPTTLRKYLSHYKSGFGFNPTTFAALKEKTADMTELELHGGLVLDEMKLSENISLRASGHAEGFVDLGPYTTNDQKVTCKTEHPMDPNRHLHFVSDFPHLIKCLRNGFLKTGFQTPDGRVIATFLMYMDDWEVAAKNGAFLSKSTAEGLRVTLESTKSLLEYLTGLGYKYLMTARLSQDCIERLFGIIRQSCGGNDHPTPSQFLIVVNCLSFYNLARSPAGGTISKGVLNTLLSSQDTVTKDMHDSVTQARADLDELVDQGKLGDAEKALALHDHISCFKEKSDSRLTFYIAGYAARKCVKTQHCSECKVLCIRDSAPVETDHPASFTKQFDRGGLVYVTDALFVLISRLESIFTSCF
ncbi:hypothetical protein IscW_ISCW005761, partial [Ixodes scapularis]